LANVARVPARVTFQPLDCTALDRAALDRGREANCTLAACTLGPAGSTASDATAFSAVDFGERHRNTFPDEALALIGRALDCGVNRAGSAALVEPKASKVAARARSQESRSPLAPREGNGSGEDGLGR
jgi:hypothetical protein